MSTARCPTCKAKLPDAALATTAPFCSRRCKLADLGNWLDGRYAIADTNPSPEDLDALLEATLGNLGEFGEEDLVSARGRSRS